VETAVGISEAIAMTIAVGILEVMIAIGIVAEAGIPGATAEAGTLIAVIVAAGEKGRSNV
jgi:hypothetical protein